MPEGPSARRSSCWIICCAMDALLRSYKSGQARYNAYLDDYAFLIAALLDLYEATGEPRWLQKAIDLDRVLEKHYEDKKNGGFFMTSDDHEQLLAREKPSYDGAEPGGNSVAVMNLLRLHGLTTDDRYRQRAVKAFQAFEKVFTRSPSAAVGDAAGARFSSRHGERNRHCHPAISGRSRADVSPAPRKFRSQPHSLGGDGG